MKFCHVDESGTGDEPFAVMAGVLVDAYRMKPTKDEWDGLLGYLTEIIGKEVNEFHTRDFYTGNSPWRSMKGHERSAVLTAIFEWYSERKHRIVFTAIDKARYLEAIRHHPFAKDLPSLWQTLATHIAISIQKANQGQKNNKGNTVLIFDAHGKDERAYSEIILNSPAWTDGYYGRSKKQRRLDQIVDVPHFVDSAHVGMIQLADCVSYFLRRHIEIASGAVPARYDGEADLVAGWADIAQQQCIPLSAMYPKRGREEAADFFYQLAPDAIVS